MAPLSTTLLLAASATSGLVSAYAPVSSFGASRQAGSFRPTKTAVFENFGLDFAEDQAENTPDIILGEANLKQWTGTVNENSFLNRQYNILGRVRELGLLKQTVDLGVLSKLEKNGVDLKTLEGLLPALESAGLLSVAGNNQQLLINLAAPLLIEPAPFLLPAVAGALEVGPPAFFLAAATVLAAEGGLVVNHVMVPFIGLPADVLLGLLLVPLAVVLGGLGAALASAKK